MSAPAEHVKRELKQLLLEDSTRVGEVYRLAQRGLNPDQIAANLGVATSGFVSNNRAMASGLLDGHVPSGPTMARAVAGYLQKVARTRGLSGEAKAYLAAQISALERAARSQPQHVTSAPRRRSQPIAQPVAARSLREHVEAEVRSRVKEWVEHIREESGIAATDYWAVVTSDEPLDVLVRLVRAPGETGTFKMLVETDRLDLSLESAVESWAIDLPLQRDLIEDAVAKRNWFSS